MEFLRDLRASWLTMTIRVALLASLLFSANNVLSFGHSTDDAINRNFSGDARKNLYSLVDTLTDPDEFWRFRESRDSLDSLAAFYNYLDASSTIELISSFDQPITVANAAGGDVFDEGYGTANGVKGVYRDDPAGPDLRDVKSVQMSEKAFDFYKLQIQDGTEPAWEDVNYALGEVPVLLGADYEEIYALGDTLDAALYSKRLSLQVVGFLGDNETMFYKNDMNFSLADKVVLPYPSHIGEYAPSDQFFAGILYFAMVNSDLVADTDVSSDQVLASVNEASLATNFTSIALIDLPSYVVQYDLTRKLLQDNKGLVFVTLALVLVISLALLFYSDLLTARRRTKRVLIYTQVGYSTLVIYKSAVACMALEAVALVGLLVGAWLVSPSRDLFAIGAVVCASVVVCVLDGVLQVRLTRTQVSNHIAGKV